MMFVYRGPPAIAKVRYSQGPLYIDKKIRYGAEPIAKVRYNPKGLLQ